MLEWIISSSFLILIVLLLRAVLGKRISAGLRYALWAIVLVRLLVPVSFFALAVPVPQLPVVDPPEAMLEASIYVLPVDSKPLEDSGVRVTEDGTLIDPSSFGYARLEDEGQTVTRYAEKITPLELLGWVWIAGAVGLGVVLVAANLRFSTRLRRMRRSLEGTSAPIPVYVAAGLPSPCLMGLLEPAVYVSEETAENPTMLRHVLAHELTHYNHLDHLWSVLRGIALAIHWWNPLVWLAVVCSRRDGELACDEGALKRLGDGERVAYGETLLALVTAKSRPGDLLCFATTMTGGKRSLKERIQRIARRPKTLVSAMVAVIVVASLSVLVAFEQAKEANTDDTPVPNEETPAEGSHFSDAWRDAEITLNEDGTTQTIIITPTGTSDVQSNPIPAPREWADPDTLESRKEAAALAGSPDVWARLVSSNDGWLVACYERGVAAANTYVYRTEDGGMNWTEVTMPGTSWHISDVGFLSPDRLIVAQRLFDTAPCFITRDGGESWEEIKLPDTQVLSIVRKDIAWVMYTGAHEGDPAANMMVSYDWGDSWSVHSAELSPVIQVDLTHDGQPESLCWKQNDSWNLQVYSSDDETLIWEEDQLTEVIGIGWQALFLCRIDGMDYLLRYVPSVAEDGRCDYIYQLSYLTEEGSLEVMQYNAVTFDLNFDPEYADRHHFDPEEISAFMDEVNGLMANSTLLRCINKNLSETFQKEGHLYDSLWWLDKAQDENLSLLDNLLNYGSYAQDHPDDVWPPLADLLTDLTEADIPMFNGDTAELVRMLQAGERRSRFYTWDSEADAYLGHGADEADYIIWNIPLSDSSTLWLLACEERSSVLVIYETQDKTFSAFYDTPELREWILAPEIGDDKLEESEEKQEKEWDDALAAEYQAAGVTMDGKNYYYQGQLVNIFLDVRSNKSFYTLDFNPLGAVNIKIIRDADNKIKGVAYMTEAEAEELLADRE